MEITEFEKKVKGWYLKNNANLSEQWFQVEAQGIYKHKRVVLTNTISPISFDGLFGCIGNEQETYSKCFIEILKALEYWDILKTKAENRECIETFCAISYLME
ncbi:MAG: hypothetical protein GQ570_15075 [Helicobacteraceae bacterium]|nr:hypothetical protein [Helicobacteraceae bacterium]